MEHICIVNEAHHRIVWQLAMALPEKNSNVLITVQEHVSTLT